MIERDHRAGMDDRPVGRLEGRRWTGRLSTAAVLLALAGACFARLVAHPSALIVDERRPSVDHANRGDVRPIGNDLTFLFLPHHAEIGRRWARFGHWPTWDARGFGGRPLAGNPQGGMFYPPVWAAWWLPHPAALGWLTVGHLLWAGLGGFVLLRSLGAGRWAATVGAGIYQASPLLLAHTFEGHYPHVWAVSWYPWAFWAYGRARRGRTPGRGLGFGFGLLPPILALTFLTGHPQEWLLLVLALSAWAVADGAAAWSAAAVGPRRGVGTILTWLGVLALSIGLAGVEMAPQWAARPWVRRNHDPGLDPGIPRRYHLSAWNGFQWLSPTALGGPADYFGDDNYWETVFSIGLAPMILAGLAAVRHPDRPRVRAWLLLAGLSVWLACGRSLGLYAVVYSVVPGMSWFRVPARCLFLANLAGAVLAGLGVEALRSDVRGSRGWPRHARVLVGGLAGIVVILYLIRADPAAGRPPGPVVDRPRSAVEAGPGGFPARRIPPGFPRVREASARIFQDGGFWLTLGGLSAVGILHRLSPRPRSRRWVAGLVGLLGLIELGWSGFALIRVAPADAFLGPRSLGQSLAEPAGTRLLPGLKAEARSWAGSSCASIGPASPGTTPPPRIKARDAFYGDLPAIFAGVEKTNVADAFQLDHAAVLYETLYPVASRERPMADRLLGPAALAAWRRIRQAVFDRMSVTHLVSDRVETDPGWPVVARGACSGSGWVIQRNPGALPRAYVVPRATILPDHAGVLLTSLVDLDARESVLMSGDPLESLRPGPRQPFTPAEWLSIDPDRPALRVTTEAPGLLVVADTWMPGWAATVDGRPARVLRGNQAQRVIPLIEPGRHRIDLDYQPPGLAVGCAITLLALGVQCSVFVVLFRRVFVRGGSPKTLRGRIRPWGRPEGFGSETRDPGSAEGPAWRNSPEAPGVAILDGSGRARS